MTGYTLTWKGLGPGKPVIADGAALRPDTLGLLDRDALEATALRIGRAEYPLNALFDVDGQAGLVLHLRDLPVVDRLGAHMAKGELVVEGDAGEDLGASMRGGLIRVHGSAGHRVGGPDATAGRGMTGGEILIDGDAGDDVGLRMRRGLIALAGRAGRSPGYRMLAGTIVLMRGPIDSPGVQMRRGTVLVLDPAAGIDTDGALTVAGELDASAMPAVALVLRRLSALRWLEHCEQERRDPVQELGGALAAAAQRLSLACRGRYRMLLGDRLELSKGEVLQWLC